MARTRLRQLEQIRSSFAYRDDLNMGSAAEAQPGSTILSGETVNTVTAPSTIVVDGDLTVVGINDSDRVTLSGGTNDGLEATISSLSYDAGNDETTLTVTDENQALINDASPVSTADIIGDPKKNLLRDLDHIRTQLRKLNQTDDWFDDPAADPVQNYELITGSNVAAGTPIVVPNSKTFDAGAPYTLRVYLNGNLLLPDTVSGNTVTVSNDYTERDASDPIETGVGDRLSFNFDIDDTDLIQLRWLKS